MTNILSGNYSKISATFNQIYVKGNYIQKPGPVQDDCLHPKPHMCLNMTTYFAFLFDQ